jgi:hypothetical protein
MSALRVRVLFEDNELDMNLLSEQEKYKIAMACNQIWKTAETPDIKYRTLPYEDGELYVYAGNVGECRCSEVEARLSDTLDWDDDHFHRVRLPEDAGKKTILYQEEDDMLRERWLVGSDHPLFDGLWASFEIVNWVEEGSVLAWYKHHVNKDKTHCSTYADYAWFFQKKYSNVPPEIWEHFDFDRMILALWRKKEIDIVYWSGPSKGYVVLESAGDISDTESFYILY